MKTWKFLKDFGRTVGYGLLTLLFALFLVSIVAGPFFVAAWFSLDLLWSVVTIIIWYLTLAGLIGACRGAVEGD